ncbi:hypothetical protein FRB94_013697 [Tulasnella sp. JGI-2019a]|nr:hypothetical protein FRB93_011972 [Tulasnella sp. JGI-2019a]KAG9008140.1 hypothetical protein FRB94_013697 [Tulasnella sp. JGI-2019a]KAG9033508.1 hypothetical protein FRB95_014687 [Tulasnella sp. JGI-2019a]
MGSRSQRNIVDIAGAGVDTVCVITIHYATAVALDKALSRLIPERGLRGGVVPLDHTNAGERSSNYHSPAPYLRQLSTCDMMMSEEGTLVPAVRRPIK